MWIYLVTIWRRDTILHRKLKEKQMNESYSNKSSSVTLSGSVSLNQSVANEVVNFLNALVQEADQLNDRVYSKLSSVMVSAQPTCESAPSSSIRREYPPLWDDIQSKLYSIRNYFDSINGALDRTEL